MVIDTDEVNGFTVISGAILKTKKTRVLFKNIPFYFDALLPLIALATPIMYGS